MPPKDGSSKPEDAPAARILVVDDEEVVHVSLRRILTRKGHAVDTVLTAQEGIERLKEHTYDLVITDLMMPQINGIELLQVMKEDKLEVPSIMITGYPTIKTALQALRLGAVDYMAKPFTRKELLGPVNRALRRLAQEPAKQSIRDTLPPKDKDGVDAPLLELKPGERVHLRRHSWAVFNQDGTMDVGIGATFLTSVSEITAIELPAEADLVEQGYVGFRLNTSQGEEHGVFMPLSGRVVAVNDDAKNAPGTIDRTTWLVRIVPDRLQSELSLLVRG